MIRSGTTQVQLMSISTELPAGTMQAELSVDVAVLGAGAAGCAAAAALAKTGRSVALIDLHARASDEFRAE